MDGREGRGKGWTVGRGGGGVDGREGRGRGWTVGVDGREGEGWTVGEGVGRGGRGGR